MKSYLTRSIFAALASVVLTCAASALQISDDRYLGRFAPPQPSGAADERTNTQYLIDLFNNDVSSLTFNGRTFVEGNGSAIPFPAPDLTANGSTEQSPGFNVNMDGAVYLLAKYGSTVAHVWYVSGLASSTLPDLGQSLGLSHVTRFGSTPRVPDGGSTIAFLGLGLALLAVARRKLA
jgi:hypothetical protein